MTFIELLLYTKDCCGHCIWIDSFNSPNTSMTQVLSLPWSFMRELEQRERERYATARTAVTWGKLGSQPRSLTIDLSRFISLTQNTHSYTLSNDFQLSTTINNLEFLFSMVRVVSHGIRCNESKPWCFPPTFCNEDCFL